MHIECWKSGRAPYLRVVERYSVIEDGVTKNKTRFVMVARMNI